MKYRRLGRSGLKVSEFCLGTMNFGPRTSLIDSHAILDEAVELGINFVDTANQYGGHLGVGTTETILGSWFAQDQTRRDKVVLATKVYEPMSDNILDRGLSARHIQMACDASLKRLQVDHIDLYQFHHIDRTAPPDEIWQATDRLIAQGKITYVGSSNFPGWKIAQMNEKALARNCLGLVSEQSLYNLIERQIELEVISSALEYGVGVMAWSPLAGGLLAGPPDHDSGRRQSESAKARRAEKRTQLAAFEDLCKEFGETPSALALSWTLHQQGICSVLIGPSSTAQLASIKHVPEISLTPQLLARLDDIFPSCGSAPEAYAW